MLVANYIRKIKTEELSRDFILWEKDSNRNTCRDCCVPFTTLKRRHHCRTCGGIFCETCTKVNVFIDGEEFDRVCLGCIREETPGIKIRSAAEDKLKSLIPLINDSFIFNSNPLELTYGSLFEPPKNPGSINSINTSNSNAISTFNTPCVAPTAGYFEIINKTSGFVGIKLLYKKYSPESTTPPVSPTGSGNPSDLNSLWEVARPSYISVPPNMIVKANFSCILGEDAHLELYILYGNPNIVSGDPLIMNYNTRDTSRESDSKFAACASISNFWQCAVFKIKVDNNNVLLKVKGDLALETRLGGSIERNGLFGSKKTSTNDSLDFSTNIPQTNITRIL